MHFLKTLFALSLVVSMFLSSNSSWGKEANPNKTPLLRRAPIIGLIQEGRLPILVKGREKSKVRIQFREADSDKISVTNWYPLKSKNDFTANLWLSEIKPATSYEYQVEFEKAPPTDWKKFRTLPASSQPGKLRFAFSSCLREKYRPHFIFGFLKEESLDFMALLGDNIYGDYDGNLNDIDKIKKDRTYREKLLQEGEPLPREDSVLESFRQKYQRNFDKHFQEMSAALPIVSTWDDHDFGEDGSDGTYPYKEISKQVFNETFPVQPY
ncbi:MAG: alkaline phosphatase D family protein, partial [Deltaproteobacteria bacterium]|nr:alkaline phosphatase D family protein [Deltaproteobacteria bacterium]